MPIQNILLGNEGVVYWSNTDISAAGQLPTQQEYDDWINAATEGANVMDVQLQIDSDFADSTTRLEAQTGWSAEVAVVNNGRVTFDVRWDIGDPFRQALIDAWQSRTGLSMAFLELPRATGVSGLIAHFSVSLQKDEALRDIQKASMTVSVARYPSWHTMQ